MKYGDVLRLAPFGHATSEYKGRAMFIRYLTEREQVSTNMIEIRFKAVLLRGSPAELDMVGRIYDLPEGPWVLDESES